jgi:nucleotide-binding universal stress UspA family protein
MKTLIAVDGSAFTQQLLDHITTQRALLGPEPQVTLLTVVPAIPPRATHYIAADVVTGYYREQADAVLAPALAKLRAAGIEAQTVYRHGHAPDVIADMATGQAFDLLVMGSHGHSALSGLVLGSVVTGTLARCKTPVLVVR